MVVIWTALVVTLTVTITKKSQKKPPGTMTTGIQTEDIWQPATSDMTINSLREELARRRLPTEGTKLELAARLSRTRP